MRLPQGVDQPSHDNFVRTSSLVQFTSMSTLEAKPRACKVRRAKTSPAISLLHQELYAGSESFSRYPTLAALRCKYGTYVFGHLYHFSSRISLSQSKNWQIAAIALAINNGLNSVQIHCDRLLPVPDVFLD